LQPGEEVLLTEAEHHSNIVPWLLGELAALPMLRACGVEEAVRASFTFYNTRDEADQLAEALQEIVRKRR
jgi:selenocysteine lyase/cysteine desulfurase